MYIEFLIPNPCSLEDESLITLDLIKRQVVITISGNSIRRLICFGYYVFCYAGHCKASVGEVLQRVQGAGEGACSGERGGEMGAVNITASACRGAGCARCEARGAGRVTARQRGSSARAHVAAARARATFYSSFFCYCFCFLPLFKIRIKASISISGKLMNSGLRYHDCTSDKIQLFIHQSLQCIFFNVSENL